LYLLFVRDAVAEMVAVGLGVVDGPPLLGGVVVPVLGGGDCDGKVEPGRVGFRLGAVRPTFVRVVSGVVAAVADVAVPDVAMVLGGEALAGRVDWGVGAPPAAMPGERPSSPGVAESEGVVTNCPDGPTEAAACFPGLKATAATTAPSTATTAAAIPALVPVPTP
jgi:hypothetical protein